MSECICARRDSYEDDNGIIYAHNTQCPVRHTEEELKYVHQFKPGRSNSGPAWKVWYGV